MFAHALGCIVLSALLAAPAVAGSSGLALCDRAIERGGVTVLGATVAQNEHLALDVEFPRRVMTVLFDKPVKVGDRILMGRYLIEHDNVRMAQGRPCTYLYDADNPRLPVVAFRCRHLTRHAPIRPTVVVRSLGEANGMTELVAFQFAGEAGAHGVPTAR